MQPPEPRQSGDRGVHATTAIRLGRVVVGVSSLVGTAIGMYGLLGADRRKEAADFMLWHLQDAAGMGTNASEGATVKATDY